MDSPQAALFLEEGELGFPGQTKPFVPHLCYLISPFLDNLLEISPLVCA